MQALLAGLRCAVCHGVGIFSITPGQSLFEESIFAASNNPDQKSEPDFV
jgi:hypothetical protein